MCSAGLFLIEEVTQYRKEQEGLEVMTVSNIELFITEKHVHCV